MTSTLLQAAQEKPAIVKDTKDVTVTPDAAVPKKRRRRTAAGGATDDCFACRKRAVKCDRKRPYCTPCIEIGKECSGYKVSLTWGVGVASRGKLRGLTCPIANKNIDGTDASPQEMEARRRRKSSVSKVKKEDAEPTSAINVQQMPLPGMSSITSQSHAQSYPMPTLPIPVPQNQHRWQVPGFQDHMQTRQHHAMRQSPFNLPPLQRLQTGQDSHYDLGMPNSAASVASYAESEYHSPMEYPHTPGSFMGDQLPPLHIPPNPFMQVDQQMSGTSAGAYNIGPTSADSYGEPMSASVNSSGSTSSFPDLGTMDPIQTQMGSLDDSMFTGMDMTYDPFEAFPQADSPEEDQKSMSLLDTRFSSPFFHLTPRMQSLLNYYDTNVCPFLVAFDGSANPYRKHFLHLAINNEGLQNAIAALATNNIRMRRKQAQQQIGSVYEIPDAAFDDDNIHKDYNEVSPEETLYKQMSIDQLNMQLSSVSAAQDDSVLATLLILCLFHVCDSGFSKFKTQLAGVQKLLSLRNPSIQSEFTGWVEMFFTWFDVMTSTVNDREMQIKGESLDMLDFSANLGALEQFSGCDGRLFKLIARLGRLNLLAQGRPVRANGGADATPRVSAVRGPPTRFGRKRKARGQMRSLDALDYDNLDGNGWGTPILSSDDDAPGSADDEMPSPVDGGNGSAPDERKEFWQEWHDIRSRLQAWQMDESVVGIPAENAGSEHLSHDQRDLVHINEAFRFSALLYTERLASPLLPSSHAQFQMLVTQALDHISALSVTSCVNKFLLWPLFITGTECADEAQRNIIRSRCVEIQKESGFFNNISGLEVLERVWREADNNGRGREGEVEEVRVRRRDSYEGGGFPGRRGGSGKWGQAFRWRRAMDRVDGEYIVI